ncbi:MAG: helix-turn-helix transcriptional regulator [Alphaproteobacteria bacterium]|jgi:transcriptional regulator with XRE-family HTH domain|nr:helix-turn-helix transcriptional regulator [Alphaproteobacteria bacterium]MBT5390185.1 helix-turn-helix transcriptional regulator [Alphaproteobacteria bacterium]
MSSPFLLRTNLDSPAKRIKALRGLTGLKREQFAQRHNISLHTLRSWELGLTNISEKSLQKLLAAFFDEGIFCDQSWILSGEGTSPLGSTPDTPSTKSTNENREDPIVREVTCFLGSNPNHVTTAIKNSQASPLFEIGDIVGGCKINAEQMKHYYGKFCILRTKEFPENLIVQLFYPSDQQDFFYLLSNYPQNVNRFDEFIDKQQIIECAPIIWHRKKFPA